MPGPRNATTTARGRSYRWRDETFDSVTTIIGGGIPKPALKAWGERLVAETAVAKHAIWSEMTEDEAIDWLKRSPWRETEKAAVQGSDIHAWAEAHILGEQPKKPTEKMEPYLAGFRRFLADWEPHYEMTEATVYNRRWGYAGTCDFIARIHGLPGHDGAALVLGDYKTGKGVYGEVALQLAAYRNAEFVGLKDGSEQPMPQVDACVCLHLTPAGYQLLPVDTGPEVFRYFCYAQQVRLFVEEVSKEVIDPPAVRRWETVDRPGAPANVAALVD